MIAVVGIDPGLDVTGLGLAYADQKHPATRAPYDWRAIKTSPRETLERRIDVLALELEEALDEWQPDGIGVELYSYQGKRSESSNAFKVGRVAGVLEGVARGWARRRVWLKHAELCPVVTLDKPAVNATLGLKRGEAAAKADVKRALERFYGPLGGNHDLRDGLAVAHAATVRVLFELRRRAS